jgi:hypothetical protein
VEYAIQNQDFWVLFANRMQYRIDQPIQFAVAVGFSFPQD